MTSGHGRAGFVVEEFLERIAAAWRPHAGQREFLLNDARLQVLACGRRWGKTDAVAIKAIYLMTQPSPSRHILLAPTAGQAALLFDCILDLMERLGFDKPRVRRTPYPRLTLGPHRLVARSGHVGRSLRGDEATNIVVDEAAFLPEAIITEVAMPMLATTDGSMTLISTPCGANHFKRLFELGREGRSGVWSRHAPSWESPHVSASFLAVQKELISERAYRVEYGAEFLDQAGRVFRQEALERCLVALVPEVEAGPVAIGIDWARYGDWTACAALRLHRGFGWLVGLERFHGLGWRAAAARAAEFARRWPGARVVCDATGVGDPAMELLREEAPEVSVRGLVFTAQSKQELIDGLVWRLERADLRLPPDPDLLRELEHFEAQPSASGHVRLRAQGGYHDDLVVALALAASGLPRGSARLRLGQGRRFARRTDGRSTQ